MNTNELKSEIIRHGDTGTILAEYLGISNPTFSNKINGEKAEFTQGEITKIRDRYQLSAERVAEIFFA